MFRPLLACAAAAMACGCADLPKVNALGPPPIDMTSPVAREVAAASNMKTAFPRFADIPNAPTDIRPVRAWSRSIYDTLRLRRVMLVEAAVAGPPPTDTEAFYNAQRERAATPVSPSVAAAAQLDSQAAFTDGVRERATPPSPAR